MNEIEEESFTAIPRRTREPITPGVHIVEITRAENGFANGKRLMELTLELSAEFWPVQTRVWKTQNSVGVMQNVLRSAGYVIEPGQRFTFAPEQLVSRMCRVRIGKNDRGYLDVLRWLPPRQGDGADGAESESEWAAPGIPAQCPRHGTPPSFAPHSSHESADEADDELPF
jgi:hypothetical protein